MQIVERKGPVIINDYQMNGSVADDPCPRCGQMLIYSDDYDALFCPHENVWMESKCSDPSCDYCPRRPDTPPL